LLVSMSGHYRSLNGVVSEERFEGMPRYKPGSAWVADR